MRKIFLCVLMSSASIVLQAQTYKVFKSDTINRVDNKGLKQGLWRKYYNTDTLFSEGVYKNNAHTGTFHTYHENGRPQSILKFRGTSEISIAELYNEDGKIMARGKYIDHTKDSLWIYFDEDGNKNAEEFYKKGLKEGTWKIFYRNGKVSKVVIYKSDKKNGVYKEFFESGTPKIMATMSNDEFEGVVTIFHPNGKVWQTGKYVNGLKDGSWIINKEDGTKEKEEIYKAGDLTNPTPDDN